MADKDMIVRVSRRKDDVLRTSDYQALFSSQWPALKPLYTGFVRRGKPAKSTIVEHNLGFRPFHLVWEKPLSPPMFAQGPYWRQQNNGFGALFVDDKRMFAGDMTDYDKYYAIFDLNIDQPFVSTKSNPGKSAEYTAKDRDFTFKVSKGAPADQSNDPTEFSVNSEMQPILVDRVVQNKRDANVYRRLEFEHNLGYPPAFYLFGPVAGSVSDKDPYYMWEIAPGSSTGVRAFATSQKIIIGITIPGPFTLVALKDPIL